MEEAETGFVVVISSHSDHRPSSASARLTRNRTLVLCHLFSSLRSEITDVQIRGHGGKSSELVRILELGVVYRVGHLVVLWVGLTLICYVPPSCPAAQPVLPISHQPKQNQAEGGTAEIKLNPTQLSKQMDHPVINLT